MILMADTEFSNLNRNCFDAKYSAKLYLYCKIINIYKFQHNLNYIILGYLFPERYTPLHAHSVFQ